MLGKPKIKSINNKASVTKDTVNKSKKYAILVGLNYIGSEAQLNGCWNDMYSLIGYLTKCGYDTNDILFLSDQVSNCKYDNTGKFIGINELFPTKKNIIKSIQNIYNKVKPGDTITFAYSGHGGQKIDTNVDENDRRDETIYVYSDDLESYCELVDDELNNILVDTLPFGVKLVCIFDSCHSGSVLDLSYRYDIIMALLNRNIKKPFNISNENREKIVRDIICFSGCRDNQTSADAYINDKYNGALTACLLTVLNDKSSLNMTWEDVLISVNKKLVENKFSQVCQLSSTNLTIPSSKLEF